MQHDWRPPTLADLVSPLALDAFLKKHYQRSWLLTPGPDDRFAGLYGWDEVNALLKHGRLDQPMIRLVKSGETLHPDAYTRERRRGGSDPTVYREVVPPLLRARLRDGATMVLSYVSETSPRLDEFCRSLERDLLTSVNINLYAGWRRDNGFSKHWDDHDVFILQLSGRKKWEVYPDTRPHPLRKDPAVRVIPGTPVWTGLLTPGDCLYIPRGWWHVAYPLDEPSLHLTTGLTTVSGEAVMQWLTRRLMASERFREDVPLVGGPEAVGRRLAAIGAEASRLLAPGGADDFLSYLEERARISLDMGLPASGRAADPPPPPARLELAVSGTPRVRALPDAGCVILSAARRTRRYPAGAGPMIEKLAAGYRGTTAELAALCAPDVPSGAAARVIAQLLRDGVVRAVPGDGGAGPTP